MSNPVGVKKKHELLTLHEHLRSAPVFSGIRVAHV